MQTLEERQALRSTKKYDILMRFYLEERAQNRHHETLIALVAFQTLLAIGAIVAACVGKDFLLSGIDRLWWALPAGVVCGGGLAATIVLQITADKHIQRSRWARKRIPWLDLDNSDKIGTAHRWIWRFYLGFFTAVLLAALAIIWKTAAVSRSAPAPATSVKAPADEE